MHKKSFLHFKKIWLYILTFYCYFCWCSCCFRWMENVANSYSWQKVFAQPGTLGKTIHLQCTTSAYSNNSSLVVFQTFSMQGFPFSLIATKCLPFKCTIKYRDCCLFFLSFLNTSLDFIYPPMISTDIEQDLKYCQLYDLSRLNFTSPAC